MVRRKLRGCVCWGMLGSLLGGAWATAQSPPFPGTVYVDRDIIRPSDWSAYESLSYAGIAERFNFDRRENAFSDKNMHLFDATYADGIEIEVQVNSTDFAMGVAEDYAVYYAEQVGRLPTSLRTDVDELWIHAGGGSLPWGGGNRSILIHVDIDAAILDFEEEILFHEAAHTSYSPGHDGAPGWLAAQNADPTFISEYARDHPTTEDVAESMLMWYALRYRSARLDAATNGATEAAIPNRLAYFDALPFEGPVDGDYNYDRSVDTADYIVWRDRLSQTVALPGENPAAATPTVVDQEDYNFWKQNFGLASGNAALANGGVPEPATSLILLLAAPVWCLRRSLTR
jgi:hypothetical protein